MSGTIGRMLYHMSGALSLPLRPAFYYTPPQILKLNLASIQVSVRNYAVRPGTRERKRKQVLKNIAAKKGKQPPLPPHLKLLMLKKLKSAQQLSIFVDQSKNPTTTDNVYHARVYRYPEYDLETAINNFKEVHHPTMFDNPNATFKGYLELDLTTKKQTQFLDNVSGVIEYPHTFDSGKPPKSVCIFCEDKELAAKAMDEGAEVAVGLEGVKLFQEGDLNPHDYDVIIAQPDILPKLSPIRGIISKIFPNVKKGTVGLDVISLMKKFKYGIDYKMTTNTIDPKLGILRVPIGTNGMATKEMAENFIKLVEVVKTHQPLNQNNKFITLGAVISDFSNERFKVNMEAIEQRIAEKEDSDADVEDIDKRQKNASN